MNKIKSIKLNKKTLQTLSIVFGGVGFLCQIAGNKVGDALSDIELNELIDAKFELKIAEALSNMK